VLARCLRILLAFELALYAAAGTWLVLERGLAVARAILLGLACACAWRLSLGLATYLLAWSWRSPVPPELRIGAPSLLGHVAAELAAKIAVYGVLQPWEGWLMGDAAPPRGPSRRLPVLLVHGYLCNRAAWLGLAARLARRGEAVWAPSFEPVYGSIDSWVPALAARVDELRAATGAPRVVLVGHSMGGLVSRAYLRAHGGAKVARLVSLGSPHRGSELARFALGQNGREMRPGSAWLAGLAAAEAAGLAAPLVSIYSHHDELVAPQTSAAHPHGRNLALAGTGHLSLLFSPRVDALLGAELEAANAG
jgi:triacylglycerol lipase